MRQSKLDPRKNNFGLQRDLALAGTKISAIAVKKRLVMGGRKAIRPVKKQLLTDNMKKKSRSSDFYFRTVNTMKEYDKRKGI